jgi:hypothetical protein
MKRPTFDLASIYSNGPKVIKVDDADPEIKATPCRKCGQDIAKDAWICKVFGGWEHRQCAADSLAEIPASRAWLALAMDAARRPRDYRTTELRQILTSVIGIAFGAELEEHDAYTEALTFAYEKRVEDALGARIGIGTLDPDQFARRWADFEWATDWDERLPLDEAYKAAWDQEVSR